MFTAPGALVEATTLAATPMHKTQEAATPPDTSMLIIQRDWTTSDGFDINRARLLIRQGGRRRAAMTLPGHVSRLTSK